MAKQTKKLSDLMSRKGKAFVIGKGTETQVPASDREVTTADNQPPNEAIVDAAAKAAQAQAVAPTLRVSAYGFAAKAAQDKALQEHLVKASDANDETKRSTTQVWMDLERIHGGGEKRKSVDVKYAEGTDILSFPRIYAVNAENRKDKHPWKYPLPGSTNRDGDFYDDWTSRQERALAIIAEKDEMDKKIANKAIGEQDGKAEKATISGRLTYLNGQVKRAARLHFWFRDLAEKMPNVGWTMVFTKDAKSGAEIPHARPFRIFDRTSEDTVAETAVRMTVNQLLGLDIEKAVKAGGRFADLLETGTKEAETPTGNGTATTPTTGDARIVTPEQYLAVCGAMQRYFDENGYAKVLAHVSKLEGDERMNFIVAVGDAFIPQQNMWEMFQPMYAEAKEAKIKREHEQRKKVADAFAKEGKTGTQG